MTDNPLSTVIVTGGGGGIGSAVATALGGRAVEVVLVDRDSDGLRARLDSLRHHPVTRYSVAPLDITDAHTVEKFAAGLVEQGTRLTGLVNAAGIAQYGGADDIDERAWNQALAVNLTGTYLMCRALLPQLALAAGAVVNVSSVSGRTRSLYTAPSYVASKAGVIGLTMSLAAQWAHRGVRVNCVAPGVTDTPMAAGYTDKQRAAMNASIPLGRFARPDEIAQPIVFLLSADASYITGETLNVNGGLFMM